MSDLKQQKSWIKSRISFEHYEYNPMSFKNCQNIVQTRQFSLYKVILSIQVYNLALTKLGHGWKCKMWEWCLCIRLQKKQHYLGQHW